MLPQHAGIKREHYVVTRVVHAPPQAYNTVMQTFLPYPSFAVSAAVLDPRRLGKQRLEAKSLRTVILKNTRSGWYNHPACQMWIGYLPALELYHDVCIREWVRRGYNNTMPLFEPKPHSVVLPPWIGDYRFHASHRAALLFKDPDWYSQWFWTEQPELNYVWPNARTAHATSSENRRTWRPESGTPDHSVGGGHSLSHDNAHK